MCQPGIKCPDRHLHFYTVYVALLSSSIQVRHITSAVECTYCLLAFISVSMFQLMITSTTINLRALPDDVNRHQTHAHVQHGQNHPLIVATSCVDATIKDICKSKAGILMGDILESDSGLFSKDQTLAALRHARNRQYLCVLFLISSTLSACT